MAAVSSAHWAFNHHVCVPAVPPSASRFISLSETDSGSITKSVSLSPTASLNNVGTMPACPQASGERVVSSNHATDSNLYDFEKLVDFASGELRGSQRIISLVDHTDGLCFDVQLTQLSVCDYSRLHVFVTSKEEMAPHLGGQSWILDKLQVELVYFTNVSNPGSACDIMTSIDCQGATRQVVLLPELERGDSFAMNTVQAFTGVFMPDTAAQHYAVVLQVQ